MKIHQKGFLLIELSKVDQIWDCDLINMALLEYDLAGKYWINHLSITLDELASAGLISRRDTRLDDGRFVAKGRLMLKYSLTDFGRVRMIDTGLLV